MPTGTAGGAEKASESDKVLSTRSSRDEKVLARLDLLEQDGAKRIEALERENLALTTQLLEQEHRTFHIWKNWYRLRREPPPNATATEKRQWQLKKGASGWALLWHMVGPQGAAAAGLPLVAVAGLILAYWANGILEEQNELFETQNAKFEQQNDNFMTQFEAESDERYATRKAALIVTLYDRKDCKLPRNKGESKDTCPIRASVRARRDA